MVNLLNTAAKRTLKDAFKDQRLALFLGAGVSVANGLPTWDKLVLSLYFATISEQKMGGWRPFSNYLYAISEWYLDRLNEPLEVTARKVRSFYEDTEEGRKAFMDAVREALYGVDTLMSPDGLLRSNSTLNSVVKLCAAKRQNRCGVRSVITYNYDSLLEMTLKGRRSAQPVFSENCRFGEELPIFHVHGYVPLRPLGDSGSASEIVFTEEQYNFAALDPYSWSNIVQLREMSGSVGLMIGLGLADRNIRRLLDALSKSPLKPKIYALLEKPKRTELPSQATDDIHNRAIEILNKFQHSGIKKSHVANKDQSGFARKKIASKGIKVPGVKSSKQQNIAGIKGEKIYQRQIRGIIEQVELLEQTQQEQILNNLGVTPIWYNTHDQIPDILSQIC